MLEVGVIGYRGHAAKIIQLIEKSGRANIQKIYHPTKTLEFPAATMRLEDLLLCDAVFILSPDHTHFDYLQYFGNKFKGFIFCEKPPVATLDQLQQLKVPADRTFFNFNYRFSRLRKAIENAIKNESVGTPVYCNAIVGHGLAYKDGYASSWRSDASLNLHGLARSVAIHYLDLFSLLFGDAKECQYQPAKFSKRGSAYDACHFSITYESELAADIIASYATPFVSRFELIGTNGILRWDETGMRIFSPRDSFDERGFFKVPPVAAVENLALQEMTDDSRREAVNFFLGHCGKKTSFPPDLFEQSIKTNRFVLELETSNMASLKVDGN